MKKIVSLGAKIQRKNKLKVSKTTVGELRVIKVKGPRHLTFNDLWLLSNFSEIVDTRDELGIGEVSGAKVDQHFGGQGNTCTAHSPHQPKTRPQ